MSLVFEFANNIMQWTEHAFSFLLSCRQRICSMLLVCVPIFFARERAALSFSFRRGDARASKDALQGLACDAVPAHSVPSLATQTSLESAVAPAWLPRQSSPPPRDCERPT